MGKTNKKITNSHHKKWPTNNWKNSRKRFNIFNFKNTYGSQRLSEEAGS